MDMFFSDRILGYHLATWKGVATAAVALGQTLVTKYGRTPLRAGTAQACWP
jgi:hypothetical protein